ncbi:MAG: AraC family transcriptional regulator [Clostridia bacterium]|nr:AraC family transcriptional regulator [Clostridia bacterium]
MKNYKVIVLNYTIDKEIAPLNDYIEYHDITICLHGTMQYIINGKEYNLSGGDCIYISPSSFRVRKYSEKCASYVSINLSGDTHPLLANTFFKSITDKDLIYVLNMINNSYIRHNQQKALSLIQYVISDLNEKHDTGKENPTVLKMKNYILDNIYKKLTVSEVTSNVFLSKEYSEALFKKELGLTITQYINSEKTRIAGNMILAGEADLLRISESLGFNDYNYFSRVFKKYTGVSPAKFRAENSLYSSRL